MPSSTMTQHDVAEREFPAKDRKTGMRDIRRIVLVTGLLILVAGAAVSWQRHSGGTSAPPAPPPPQVTVGTPLQETVAATTDFLGQFSAVDTVELTAQVGGTLTEIAFRDGQIVQKGDLLFVIDPRPFQIRLDQAAAQLQKAQAKEVLASAELWRAQQLRQTSFGTVESVDQRAADQRSAEAAIETAKAAIRDAQLDLEFSRVVAPFTGRVGAHLVSVGSVVSGSRGTTNATTPLASIVSLDPIHLDFDMSEADYLAFQQSRRGAQQDARRGAREDADVDISLNGDGHFDRRGTLDFIDNEVNRSSGTIHARATVPNPDLSITPGQFARVRVATGIMAPVLLVPGAAVVPDQSRHVVMTVAADGTVVPKPVETGGLYQGLRIIESGLQPTDRVVIDGLARVQPGATVKSVTGVITRDPGSDNG
jgi:multidrug efflux system membrane fusion protein